MRKSVELRQEHGQVVAYCEPPCEAKLTGTTAKIQQLMQEKGSDKFESFCFRCGATAMFDLDFGP